MISCEKLVEYAKLVVKARKVSMACEKLVIRL
jgi:hypothetical protein